METDNWATPVPFGALGLRAEGKRSPGLESRGEDAGGEGGWEKNEDAQL